jgi:ribose transport system ATP-binding protein
VPRHSLIEVEHLSKRFGETQAVADVSLTILEGEIHALVGENGAGKSTLGRIMGGVHRPDHGLIRAGSIVTPGWSTRQALAAGVATIQQELSLVPDLTVAQNAFLGIESHRFGMLQNDLRARYETLEDHIGFGLDPDATVRDLKIADQQKAEILRALARDAKVIIMDEPTSSLTADETAKLHNVMKMLKEEGRAILYVTHFLDAALEHADRVSVMRDGHLVSTRPTTEATQARLVEEMLGRSIDIEFPSLPPAPPPGVSPILELHHVRSGRAVRDVSLSVRPGEIVGLAGLVGSGRTEITRVIYGADPLDAGEIRLFGQPYRSRSPRRSIGLNLVLIPENRRTQGLVMTQSVARNISLPHPGLFSRFGVASSESEGQAAQRMVTALDIHASSTDVDVALLSGGNQQKVLFAKWMVAQPRIVLLDEPTRGVDVGAKQKIYQLIMHLATEGAAVLLISSELEEVLGLSHRVYMVREGEIIGEVDPRIATVDYVLYRLFGVEHEGAGRPSDGAS